MHTNILTFPKTAAKTAKTYAKAPVKAAKNNVIQLKDLTTRVRRTHFGVFFSTDARFAPCAA